MSTGATGDPGPAAVAPPGGPQTRDGDPEIEVGHDVDSAVDPDDVTTASAYTASLTSSVVDYPVECGRQYHAFRSGYSRPNDQQELDRLEILHAIMTTVQGGLYSAPVEKTKVKHILDIGAGTGTWAMMVGDEFPQATVLGNDLSANMPSWTPPNVKFEVDDVESEWLHGHKFSWIFCRYMAASIHDWPRLVRTVADNLEPGGWAEFQDFDLQYYSEDGSLAADDALLVWITTLLDCAARLGRDPNPGRKLEGLLRGTGLQDVVHTRYKIPFGPWARDPLLKKVGLWNYHQLNSGLEGLTMRLYTTVLKWKPEEVYAFLAKVRESLRNPRVHATFDFHVVYGRKPAAE